MCAGEWGSALSSRRPVRRQPQGLFAHWHSSFLAVGEKIRVYIRVHLLSDTDLLPTESLSLTFLLRHYTGHQAQYRRLI